MSKNRTKDKEISLYPIEDAFVEIVETASTVDANGLKRHIPRLEEYYEHLHKYVWLRKIIDRMVPKISGSELGVLFARARICVESQGLQEQSPSENR